MLWWSIACALHGFASGFGLLLCARFLLGMGEGGGFPAAIRVVAEWISPEHRSTAVGIINAGTAVGSVLAPPLIGFVLLHSGWRAVFYVAGAIGLAWVRVVGAVLSRQCSTAHQLWTPAPLRTVQHGCSRMRIVQVLVFAKFMSDSAWYFLLFWLPKYLYDARHFDIKQVSYYAWIPYAASGIGSFLGGYFSSRLLRRGLSIDQARKIALGLSAAFMPAVMLVPLVPVQLCACAVQHRVLLPAIVVGTGHDSARRHLAALRGRHGFGLRRLWRSDWRSDLRQLWPATCSSMVSAMEPSLCWSGASISSAFLPSSCSAAEFNHYAAATSEKLRPES